MWQVMIAAGVQWAMRAQGYLLQIAIAEHSGTLLTISVGIAMGCAWVAKRLGKGVSA